METVAISRNNSLKVTRCFLPHEIRLHTFVSAALRTNRYSMYRIDLDDEDKTQLAALDAL